MASWDSCSVASWGSALMVARRAGRKSQIPFGPFMLAGAFVAILWGGALADLYLDHVLGLIRILKAARLRADPSP